MLLGESIMSGEARHRPKKRFGQHFLTDSAVIDAIVAAIDAQPGARMLVEIGPGLSALTAPLLKQVGQLTVIELDRDLARRLRSDNRLRVIESDVLAVDFTALARQLETADAARAAGGLRIVGNLPYNISTPILFHLLEHVEAVADQHFMLQKEVVERMVAAPSTAAYGRVSVMLQWRYEMTQLFIVGPEAFEPPPKVHSAVVQMRPRETFIPVQASWLRELLRVAFSQRRKLLRHTLGAWLDQLGFADDFDVQRRAEEVSVDAYLALAVATQPTKG
ncbi:MAG: 16S rRNA (adenine(1518)-N(6)/adenine(1519)-N(6))-dimethyltransferase RsmA [Burkholderiales bacterium]